MGKLKLSIKSLALVLFVLLISPVQAYDCVLDIDDDGVGDGTSGANSDGSATRVACGNNASAAGNNSTALGNNASAAGSESTALGLQASAAGDDSTALGRLASSAANGSSALGEDADVDSVSLNSLALGHDAKIVNAEGGIAIGADANNNGTGAIASAPGAITIGADSQATAEGAIAIGANVVADIANTLITNVPIFARDVDTTVAPRTMFEISGFGNTKFTVTNADAMEQWAFANPGTGFRLSRQGSGAVEFEVKNNGNVVIAGNLTENSDHNNKQDIQALDQQAILKKVMDLNISEWRYKNDPHSRHIGPMAQDFYQAFELGDTNKGISSIDTSGVALAAIQALNVEKDNEIDQLKSEMTSMKKELIELKAFQQQLASILAMTGGVNLTQVKSE